MQELKEYNVQISGLKEGVHQFDFRLDAEFFAHFPASPIKEADLKADFYFDKQPGMYVLVFEINGTVVTECDRCLEPFSLPISSSNTLIGKFSADQADDADVIHIPKTTVYINVAEYLYEFAVLSVPMSKTHEDADEDCPEDVFGYLDEPVDESKTTREKKNNPFSDALKNFGTDSEN